MRFSEEIAITRKGRDTLAFQTIRDVEAFIEREVAIWGWTTDVPDHPYGQINNVRNSHRPAWTEQLIQHLRQWSPAQDVEIRQHVMNTLTARYSDGVRLCADDNESAALSVLAETDKQSAVVALATVIGSAPIGDQNFLMQAPQNRIGVARGMAILAELDRLTFDGVRKTLRVLKQELQKDNNVLRSNIADAQRKANDFDVETRSAVEAQNARHENSFAVAEDARRTQYEVLTNALEAVKDAYEVRMELQGPVRYWQKKAKRHRNAKWGSGLILVIYSIVSVIALFVLFEQAANHLPTAAGDQIPFAALFKAGAFALLMSSIAFWIGRVLLRIFLSNQHLATDAEERMTMVMTFLALVRRKAIKDEDRAVILTPLFRAGSDGIVKEESAPDTAIAAFISALAKK